MTYKTLYSKIEKSITNLSASLELEEYFYIQEDVDNLCSVLKELDKKVQDNTKIVSLKDFHFKNKCLNLVDEANFYIAEANEVL